MRRGNDPEILKLNGKFVGINLSADYCAEHEWGGISKIKNEFDVTSDKDLSVYGLERRKIRELPADGVMYSDTDTPNFYGSLLRLWHPTYKETSRSKKPKQAYGFGLMGAHTKASDLRDLQIGEYNHERGILSAWSDHDFGFIVTDKYKDEFDQVIQAFKDLDIAFWLGGGGVFQNAGLCIGIASKLPEHVTKAWYDADLEHHHVELEVEASGIKKILKDAGKTWFALKAKRGEDGKLRFWLKPYDQGLYNSTWCSLEDLRLWAQDKGPIMRTGVQKMSRTR